MKFWIIQIFVWVFGKHIVRLIVSLVLKPFWWILEFIISIDVNAQLSDDMEGSYSEQLSSAIAEDWLDSLDYLDK